MTSIHSRLTIYIIAGMAVLLTVAGLTVDYLLRGQLETEFDRNLLAKAMTLVSLTEQEAGKVEFDFRDDFMPEFEASERAEFFELWHADGTLIERSPSLRDADLPSHRPSLDIPRYADVSLPDGRPGRMVEVLFVPQVDEDDASEESETKADQSEKLKENDRERDSGTEKSASDIKVDIAVARGIEDLDDLIMAMRTTLFVTFITLMAAVALLVRLAVTSGLAPLHKIAREVQELDVDNLNTGTVTTPNSEELIPITNQINHLLERMTNAFQREKRFSGDVAHELRTPIAELRTMAEVGKEWPADQEMVKNLFGDLVNLSDDMERTVTNLLMLGRLDAGIQVVRLETVNLLELIENVWKRIAGEADKKSLHLDNQTEKDLVVRTDKDKLKLMLINILSNAVSYSPEHSTISVHAQRTDGRIQIAVSNLTLGLAEHDLAMMFERFWRKDEARAGDGRHAGLGLSLVKALADILSIKIGPLLDANRRFTITLSGMQPV